MNVPGPAGEPFEIFAEEMGKNISPEAKGFVNHVFILNDTDEIRQLIRDAGFSDVDVQANKKMLSLPAPRDFLWQYVQSTTLVGVLAKADDEAIATLETEVVDQWRQFVDDGAFMYKQRLVTASARK